MHLFIHTYSLNVHLANTYYVVCLLHNKRKLIKTHGLYSLTLFGFLGGWIFKLLIMVQFSSVQSFSHVRLFVTPWIAARQASLSITNSQSSLKLTSIESVMPCSHLILCCPLLLLPPIPPSIRVFSNESYVYINICKLYSISWHLVSSFHDRWGNNGNSDRPYFLGIQNLCTWWL